MSEEIVTKELINTFQFGRKVGLPNYGNTEASLFVQFPGDLVNDPEQWEANFRAAQAKAAVGVLTALGLPVVIDNESWVREKLETSFEGATVTTTQKSAAAAKPFANKPFPNAAPAGAGGRKTLGVDDEGRTVTVATGNYGAYVSDGTKADGGVNATLYPPVTVDNVTLEQAIGLLAKKRAKS